MATFRGPGPVVALEATISLSEGELRAIDALAGYGTDAFLKVFYEKMGEHYMKPHEGGLRSLFETINREGKTLLYKVDEARKVIKETPKS